METQTQESQIVHILLREALGLAGSAVALAKILKVSRISIWSWEHNEYLPRGRNLLAIINYVETEKSKRKENAENVAA